MNTDPKLQTIEGTPYVILPCGTPARKLKVYPGKKPKWNLGLGIAGKSKRIELTPEGIEAFKKAWKEAHPSEG